MTRTKVFILLFLLLISCSTYARTLDEIKKSGVILLAADGATPPFNYYKGKDLVGFEVDLANEIAKRLGVKTEWVVKPFNTLLIGVNEGRFDLIATSHAVTAKRAEVVDFIMPHYCTGAAIISKAGGPKTGEELKGKVVVVPVGTVYYDKLKTMNGIKEVRTVPNETDGLQNLLAGRADAWVTEMFVGKDAIKAHKDAHLQLGEIILPQQNAMVVAKGNSTLKAAVDAQLKKMLKDGTYASLDKKYFDSDIRCK